MEAHRGPRLEPLRGALVLAVGAACAGGDRASSEGGWELGADSVRSEGDAGARSVPRLRTVGKEGPHGDPQTEAVVLSFDCLPGHAISTIMTNQALRQGSVDVELRLDADRPRRLPGFAGTTPSGGQLVFTISQDSMLALLRGHQRAVIEYADAAGSSKTTAVFSVAGLEKYPGPVPGGLRGRRRRVQLASRERLVEQPHDVGPSPPMSLDRLWRQRRWVSTSSVPAPRS